MSETTRPIAVMFHRFGPYHFARLKALSACAPAVAVEVVRKDATYDWEVVRDAGEITRVTLFPELTNKEPQVRQLKRRLFDCLAAQRPSAVAIPGWASPYALLALSWCLKTATPAVLMSESTKSEKPRTWLAESIKGRLLRLYQASLVGGRRHAEYLRQLGFPGRAVAPGYDVVDNAHFAALPDGKAPPRTGFLVSCRFVPDKNLQRLLEAYSKYCREAGVSAWRLVLAGDGPDRSKLVETIRALGISHAVSLPGFVQYQDLPALYAAAGAFILPSASEPWGLVVNEAMAASLPVLVSNRCGCSPDLVEEGRNGFTFDPFDADELARLMHRVSGMSAEARGAMARASRDIISHWTPETFGVNLAKAAKLASTAPRLRATVLDRTLLSGLVHRHSVLP